MTKQEINSTIQEYWKGLYQTDELPNIDHCIWRVNESRKIGNYLLINSLMEFDEWLQEGKKRRALNGF